MPINPGKLDRRLTIQALLTVKDAAGGPVDTFLDVATVWCAREDATGKRFEQAHRVNDEANAAFTIRFYKGLTQRHRAVCESVVYEVLSIQEQGRRELQLLVCRALPLA